MKKLLKIMACAMMVIAMAGVMNSCKNHDIRVLYSFSTNYDVAKEYLKSHGAVYGDKLYSVKSMKSEADCYEQANAMAKSDFENSISKLNADELKVLLEPGTTATYRCTRADEQGGVIEIAKWECSGVDIPTEFGKLNVGGVDYIIKSAVKSTTIVSDKPGTRMTLIADNAKFSIRIVGLEQPGAVPVGHYDIDGEFNKCFVYVGEKKYNASGNSCDISMNGKFYKFVSSGKATAEDGSEVDYTLNCDNVYFEF